MCALKIVASRFAWILVKYWEYYGKTLRIRDLAVYGLVNGLKVIFASKAFVSCCLSSTIL